MKRNAVCGVCAAALVTATLAAPADARGTIVTPLGDTRFEIASRTPGAGGASFWCGASVYVVKSLKRSWQTNITIERGRGKSASAGQRESVVFTLNPEAAGIATGSVGQINALAIGDTMPAQLANIYCRQGGGGSNR